MQDFCQTILALTVDVVTIGTDPLPQLYSQAVDAGLGHTAGHSRHSPGTSDLLTHTRHNHTLYYIMLGPSPYFTTNNLLRHYAK